jgi:PAS domain S-box-containing protein
MTKVEELEDRIKALEHENSLLKNRLEFHEFFEELSSIGDTFRAEDGKLIYVSPSVEQIIGYSKEDYLKGKIDFIDLVHPDDIEIAKEHFQKLLKKQNTSNLTCRIYDKYRTIKYLSVTSNFVFNHQKEYLGFRTRVNDITEIRQKEEALKESEENYKKIIENLTDIYYRANADGKIDLISPSGLEIFGYSSMEEIFGRSLELVYQNPNERDEFVAQLKKTGKIKNYRTVLTKKDGSDIYVETTANIILDRNGDYAGVEGIVRDITDRKRAELALQESEERYRQLVEQSPFSIAIYQDGCFVYANPAGVSLVGAANQQEIIGKTVLSIVHPESRAEVINRMELVAQGISVPSMEKKLIRLDGSGFDADVVTIATTFNNKPAGQVIVRNITEYKRAEQALRESEERWKTIINTSPDGLSIADLDGMITFVSEKSLAMLGYSDQSEIVGRNIFEFMDKAYHLKAATLLGELLRGNYTGVAEYLLIKRDGTRIFMEINAEILHNNEGVAQSVFFALRDITERKRAEAKLVELNHQQKELNATKDKLLSIIAHDLRSPFSSIIGFSDLLGKNLRKYDIEESEKFIELINTSAKHTLNLLDNLLDWAKAQTGQIDFNPEQLKLQPIIRELVDVFEPSARIKSISLNRLQSKVLAAYADRNMLKTILRNLISNAIKFTHVEGTIDIYAISDSECVEITVADNGVGMVEEIRNKLFETDKNPTTSGTANEKGSGLGLMLCKEFVEKHGGRIWVKSELGKGSEFKFTLPKLKGG